VGRWGSQLDTMSEPKRENLSRSTAPPRRVLIPALAVDAPVDPVGVDEQRLVDIPGDGDRIGWYQFGVRPGESNGSAVLIGHRDTEAEGPGALFELDALVAGDEITVVTRTEQLDYEVVARQSFVKQALPSRLFDRSGPHRLTLITCGGPYLADRGGYQENLVVTAELVERSDRAGR
jgi:LPXTG-site transpeptidase (sortase) family protein